MSPQLWIEPVSKLIVVRIRGIPTEGILKECHERLLTLLQDTGQNCILYDCLEMEVPPVEVPLSQWKLDLEIDAKKLKRAIVVPNTKLAYLARLAFGDGNYRVFYNDLSGAVQYLNEEKEDSLLSFAR